MCPRPKESLPRKGDSTWEERRPQSMSLVMSPSAGEDVNVVGNMSEQGALRVWGGSGLSNKWDGQREPQ